MTDLGNEGPKGVDTKISSKGETQEVKNPLAAVEKIFGFLANLLFGSGEKKQSAQKVLEQPQISKLTKAIDQKITAKAPEEKAKHSGAYEAIGVIRGKTEAVESEDKELAAKNA